MELRERWPIIDRLCECAAEFPELELWAFGSMLRTERPSDLDILIVYSDRADVEALREMELWEVDIPPVDIIAMTPDEVACYHFVEITRAVLLAPGRTG